MSGTIIHTPDQGDNWGTAWTQVEYARKGGMGLSVVNYDTTDAPAIAAGSWVEDAGSVYNFATENVISGTPSSSTLNYIKLVPSGSGASAVVTATWTTDAPTWSDTYQGYYDGTSRYVVGCYFNVNGYSGKWIYKRPEDVQYERPNGSPRPLKIKTVEIGDWDMNATASIEVMHGIDGTNVRWAQIMIRNDLGVLMPLGNTFAAAYTLDGWYSIATTSMYLYRKAAGVFDSTAFESTGYNRGFINLAYED